MWWPFKRKPKVPQLTHSELSRINRIRRSQKRAPLEYDTAQTLVSTNYSNPGFDMTGFLIGYSTGIPWGFTPGAIMGAAMHSSPAAASEPSYNSEPLVPRYNDDSRQRNDEPALYTPQVAPVERETFYNPPASSSESSSSYSSSSDSSSSYSSSDSSSSY